jgi:hypothetical protein
MYAVLGIMVMFAFVILPIYMQGDSRRIRNPLVVSTTRYGKLDEEHLAILRQHHTALERFYSQLSQQGSDAAALGETAAALARTNTERDVVEQWLLENRAEELGLDVGEEAITQYLNEALTAAKISNEQVNSALHSAGISQDQLFSLLRNQFLARRLVDQFNVSLAATTPEQRWDYYQRLHRRAVIEVAGLPVSDYTAGVADPGDAVLKAYFEKYKTHFHHPALPAPGFKEPKRVAFEYLKADYSKLTGVAKVSEDEIQKYYNEHKDELYKQNLPELPGKLPLTPPAPPAPVKPADAGTRGHGDTEKGKPAVDKPAAEKPAGEKPASSGAGKSSALPLRSLFHLTAFLDDSSSEEPAAKADKKVGEKPVAKPESKPSSAPAATPASKPAAKPAGEPAAKQEPPPPSYQPLEKVRDEIRQRLAQGKVHDLLERLRQQFQEYHSDLAIYKSQGTEENAKPPLRPDFKSLAKEYGLEARDSGGLRDAFEARALDIGSSNIEGRSEFVSVVFQKLNEFLPRISTDLAGNQYLFWKTEETAEKVSEWSDKGVREKVLAAWRLEQARSIAEKEAQGLAKTARQSKQPLGKALAKRPGMHIYLSDPFSWLTEGSIPGSNMLPEISQIRVAGGAAGVEEAVQTPGDGFMQAVFHRNRGDLGVAMNQPETIVYVFRIVEMTPANWDVFVHEGSDPYSLSRVFRVYYLDRERVERAWFKSIEEAAGMKWEREPVEAARGEE